ncbi:MAG TPA: prolyl oligopeptidase family serine peptidase [Egibacteraceae bacterium]|nr:prolyl oligopeptidase family serine peptidase [Egibacteraceae bacterium]
MTARAFLAGALTVALMLGFTPASAQTPPVACTDDVDEAIPFSVTVEGEEATGHYALPDTAPVGLVTFAHGYGHTSASWTEHLRNAARDLGVIALAMDYRGTHILPRDGDVPTSRGWRVAEGAVDTITAAQQFEAACPGLGTITNFGVSMGGNASGLAQAQGAKRADGTTPLFDYWINVEGAANVIETYFEARVLAPANTTAANAVADIEEAFGGTFEQVPDVYRERAVVTRADDIAASGVKGVLVIHGVDDGLVPPNQSRELVTALRAAGVRTEMVTIALRDEDTESDTTITGYAAGQVDPDYRSPFVGHASERSTTHVIMREALGRLGALYRDGGQPICDGERYVDPVNNEDVFVCDAS